MGLARFAVLGPAVAVGGCAPALRPQPSAAPTTAEQCTAVAARLQAHLEELMLESAEATLDSLGATRGQVHAAEARTVPELEAGRVDRSTPIRRSCLQDWSAAVADDQRRACAMAALTFRQTVQCLGVRAVPSFRRAVEQSSGVPFED